MSVVSSNMVMSEGNPRVAGGRVLLPLVAEPVGVFVPFSRTQIQTREKVEKKSRLEFKLLSRDSAFLSSQETRHAIPRIPITLNSLRTYSGFYMLMYMYKK